MTRVRYALVWVFVFVVVWSALIGGASVALADDSVVNTVHDLSARGPGPIRAHNEGRVCVFCHTPHNAAPQSPLWNRYNARTNYRIYRSSTLDARVNQPSGPSKMCLSCHDGSLALGGVRSEPVMHPILTTPRTIPPGPADLTSDLTDDHPIGFRYDRALAFSDPQLRIPEVFSSALPLGRHNEVHCTTCHDPHNNRIGDFLRVTDRRGTICLTCHEMKGWPVSGHAISRQTITGRRVDPREPTKYHTVADNACLNCHKIHSASQPERLLRFRAEESNCLNCHDGSVASTNILADIRKRSAHQVFLRAGIHDPAERPRRARRHVECVDCHNPHAVRPISTASPTGSRGLLDSPATSFVSGVDRGGARVEDATYTYEICFKCHSDNVARRRTKINRQIYETNTRLEFQTSNPSFHPVVGPRRNSSVVSLIPPLRSGSMITCIDCHNGDNARTAGGSGPSGPHGSIFEPLLVANYETQDFTTESAQAYALCYRCHDRNSILSDESFPLHSRHIVNLQAPCATCHDAHGVRRVGLSGGDHTNLINFNLSIVQPVEAAGLSGIEYRDTGRLSGNCTLRCHGVNHIRFPYSK